MGGGTWQWMSGKRGNFSLAWMRRALAPPSNRRDVSIFFPFPNPCAQPPSLTSWFYPDLAFVKKIYIHFFEFFLCLFFIFCTMLTN